MSIGLSTSYSFPFGSLKFYYRSKKCYELSNQLGSVLAVITDRRIQACAVGDSLPTKGWIMHYYAQVVSVSVYYPGRSLMSERSLSAAEYRFGGAGGQEMDKEISGKENSTTAEYLQYDSRLMRRFNTDPLMKPWESVYATFSKKR